MALALALAALAWDLTEEWRRSPPAAAGRLLVPLRGGLVQMDLGTGQERELVSSAPGTQITAAAWAPDRTRLAYSRFHRRPEDQVGSAEIFAVPAEGGSPELLVPRDRPGDVLDTPIWAPDGRTLYFGYLGFEGRRPTVRLERVLFPGGDRRVLYEDGSFPAVSPDGRTLAFVKDDPNGQGLWAGPAEGGTPRELIRAGVFSAIMGPRFSPDGSRLAFTAVGGGPKAGGPAGLLGWLAPPIAHAHGDPWSLWTSRADGTDLRRVGSLQEDEPLVAWSPDGRWFALLGTGGLWLLDAEGGGEPRRLGDGSFGAIDWAT